MGLEWRLAWRNVWRNPRRTALTVAATVFAVVLVVVFLAMGNGIHQKMIEDTVRLHSGHVTLSAPGYLDNRTLERFIELDEALAASLGETEGVAGWAPRVVGFALLSKTETSRGSAILGVDPAREREVTSLAERVRVGRFLNGGTREIVLGRRLADALGAGLGDEVLVYGVAYSLETAYELFEVVGLAALPDAALERSLAIVDLADAQDFFVYGERVSEVAILAESGVEAAALRTRLLDRLEVLYDGAPTVAAHTWQEVLPELDQIIFLDDAGMVVMLAILIVVVGFGILNTVLMAVLERTRELGVMLALGLRPGVIFRMVYLESIFLAALGLTLGLALAIPVALFLQANPVEFSGEQSAIFEYFGFEPVFMWKLKASHLWNSAAVVFGVALLAAAYPAHKASRARPVDALMGL